MKHTSPKDFRENLLIVFMHMDVEHYLNEENAIYVLPGWHRIKIGKQNALKHFKIKFSLNKFSDKFLFAKLSSGLDFVNTIFHLANGFVPKSRCILSDTKLVQMLSGHICLHDQSEH